ncbi:MAG: hypothetical protein V4651_10870 [Bacteroidota bacterium]
METMNLTEDKQELLKKALSKEAGNSLYISLTKLTNGKMVTATDVGELSDGTIIVCGSGPSATGGGAYPVVLRVAPNLVCTVFNSFVKDPEKVLTGSATGLCVVSDDLVFITYNTYDKTKGLSTQLPYLGVLAGGALIPITVTGSFALPLNEGVSSGNANSVYISLAQGLVVPGSFGEAPLTAPVIWEVTYNILQPLTLPTFTTIPLKYPDGARYGEVFCASFVNKTTFIGGDTYSQPTAKFPGVWTVIDNVSTPKLLSVPQTLYAKVINSSPNGSFLCGAMYVPADSFQPKTTLWAWNGKQFNFVESKSILGASATLVNDKGTIVLEVLNDTNSPYIVSPNTGNPITLLQYFKNINTDGLPSSMSGFTANNLSVNSTIMVGNGIQEAWIVINPFTIGGEESIKRD